VTAHVLLMTTQPGQQGGGALLGFLPFILIIVIMYFLMIRPQVKRQKERQKMLDGLKKGDEVLVAGIYGKIVTFTDEDKAVIVKVDDNTKLKVDRSSVSVLVKASKDKE
jgi:preprotein translocase subunit YajC